MNNKLKEAHQNFVDDTTEHANNAKEKIFESFMQEIDFDSMIANPNEYQQEMIEIFQTKLEPYLIEAIEKGQKHGVLILGATNGSTI